MQWKLLTVPINKLVPRKDNPRKLSKSDAEQLSRSIEKFGLCEPIVANADMTVIGGHQRLTTLKKLGVKDTEVYVPEKQLSDQECDELCIRLNKNSGEWDFDILANEWEPEPLLDWGFSLDELHLEEIPNSKEKPKTCELTAKFENEDDLRQAEVHIAAVIDKYASASYKVRVK